MKNPKLTIVSISYNQEKYIAQTLESFVMQQTDFPFEVLISDDASTDKTPEIIREYANKYPDIIKPIYREINTGGPENYIGTLSMAKSKYLIVCEGDDYFTDPLKLQKQVDFLDCNPDFSICFHPVRIFYEDGSVPDSIYPMEPKPSKFQVFTMDHLLQVNIIQTNSALYRWRFNGEESIRDVFSLDIIPGDYFLHLLHAQKGKIGMLNEVMADYRRHSGGIWWGSTTNAEPLHLKHGVKEVKFYLELEKRIPESHKTHGHRYTLAVAYKIFDIYKKHQKTSEMQQILDICPDLLTILESSAQK